MTFSPIFFVRDDGYWIDSCISVHVLSDFGVCTVMGKVEGEGDLWHGHVTAVTVAPNYRRQQLAKKLMFLLEEITEKM